MLLQNRYEYNPQTDAIAEGSAARVYTAYDNETDKPVIIKFYHAISVEHQTFQNNMERIKQLHHPNLVQLYDYFVLETINYLGQSSQVKVGVWEYVPGNTVELPLSDEQTEHTLRATISGLQYLYQNGCAHLDLDFDNILIDSDKRVKLNNYEITNTNPENEPNTKADLKGLGEVLHRYCTGEAVKDNSLESIQSGMREVYAVIIRKCLHEDAQSVAELLDILNNYESNKRFDEVLPLQTKQAQSRYSFEMNEDLLEDTHHSYIFKAYDNLLDCSVTLEIFKADPNRELLQKIDQSKYAYLFKLQLPDETETFKIALAGIIAPSSAQSDDNHIIALLAEQEQNPTNTAGDTATLETDDIPPAEVAENIQANDNDNEVIVSSDETKQDSPETETWEAVTIDNEEVIDLSETDLTDELPKDEDTPEAKENDNTNQNDSIFVIEVKDYIEAPHASSPKTDELERTEIAISLPTDDSVDISTNLAEDTNEDAINIEFVDREPLSKEDNDDDLSNTEVIVQSAIDQVNADLGKELQEMQDMQNEMDNKLSINIDSSDEQPDNTGSFAPTGLIKVEAYSQLREDLENSKENEEAQEKDRYIDIAINTLKDDEEVDLATATDTQLFEHEAMEQVRKDLEKLLSEDDEDEKDKDS